MSKSLYKTETKVLLEVLRELRGESGLTQAQCSQALGRPQSFISDVERGVRRLDLIQLRDLCHVFGINLRTLVGRFERHLAECYEHAQSERE
ncbi:helix-turn-helix domain-containing protein [Marinimicrobium agarilyticum]|uniref:helix-turn-helix domain-containing protein n=1 Tax=Marinimicrobium agarilyticum TaxID=306546 RepID=UPI000411F344|nr:helix-turn-helix transcriptional regulator [Marinimicrobium agarilyticum]